METHYQEIKCTSVVIKIASRCNLNCTYCYMYNKGDETYKQQPKYMSPEVVEALLQKSKSHCLKHGLKKFLFQFHGGEPMLAGMDFFRNFVAEAHRILGPEQIQLRFVIQTNGVLLSEEWCKVLGELNIHIGVSLDGTPEENDKFRIDHAGRGSYDKIVKGLKTAQNSPYLKSKPGCLSVLNIESDPIETYEHFKDLKVSSIDFLFPANNYDDLPPGLDKATLKARHTPYADWLIPMFDKWFEEKGKKPNVRIFSGIIESILGNDFPTDSLGKLNNEILVIETDGGIESIDVLKICGHGFTKAGANVLTNDFDQALRTELAELYNFSHTKLCTQCANCPVREVCGGGYLPNRYSSKTGFHNPSVYCADLMKLITHIQAKVMNQIPEDLLEQAGISTLTFEEGLEILKPFSNMDLVEN
jgi:uncharacterized protein